MADLTYEEQTRAIELAQTARPLAVDVWMEFTQIIRQYVSTDDLILLEKWTRPRWADLFPYNVLLLDTLTGTNTDRLSEICHEYEGVWRNDLTYTVDGLKWGEEWELEIEEEEEPEQDPAHIEFIEMPQFVHPALDLADGIVYLSQQRAMREVAENGRIIEVMRPVIITSDRQVWRMPHYGKRPDVILRLPNRKAIYRPLERATDRWSLASMQNFLGNGATVNPWALYLDVERIFRQRVWTPNEGNYVIFGLYVFLSYVFPIFEAVPYLHLAGLPGTGKTTVAKLMAQLGLNGRIVVDPTEASLFRDIEQDRPLMVLDEQENIGTRKAGQEALSTILKGGYKKGLTVPRQEKRGNAWVTVNFDVFCPKVIANVHGLEDILADRAIPVVMRAVPAELASNYQHGELTSEALQGLVDNLYLFTMLHMPRIAKFAYGARHRFFSGRTGEIFGPLLTLAAYLDIECADTRPEDRDLYDELATTLQQAEQRRQSSKSDSPEETLRQALWGLLQAQGTNEAEFSSNEIAIEFYALHTSPPTYFNDAWLGRTLAKMDIVRGNEDKRRGSHPEEVPHFDHKTGDVNLDWMVKKRLTYYTIRGDRL